MKHCWSCAKSHICEKYNPNKKACKEHRFANGMRSEQIKQKKQYESIY